MTALLQRALIKMPLRGKVLAVGDEIILAGVAGAGSLVSSECHFKP